MKIPILYNVRSVLQRPLSTSLTALGVARRPELLART